MIIRYRHRGRCEVGWLAGEVITKLGDELSALLRLPAGELRLRIEQPDDARVPVQDCELLAPIDGRTEVWAAGVTYGISQDARMEESVTSADVYAKVYDADRPELFFKSVGWRVVPDGGEIRIRADSPVNVPEPELALLINAHREVVGFGVCNDMSSRSIEADNPLYLPQAKIYTGACSLSAGVTPVWQVDDPYSLELRLSIMRAGVLIWHGSASVGQLHRRLDDLVDWLHRELDFPDGVWLSTGTCLVPDLPFTVLPDDVISIGVPGVGELTNHVGG